MLALASLFGIAEHPVRVQEPLETLAKRAKDGDRKSLERLVRELVRPIGTLCRHVAGQSDSADATQDALLRIVERLGAYDPTRGSFRSWAYAVARHSCIDRKRSAARGFLTWTPEEIDNALSNLESPHDALETSERRSALERGMSTLPEPVATALVLFHVHSASYEEIATVLDVPIGTVMTWLHRGRKKLRTHLDTRSTTLEHSSAENV